MFCWKTTAKKIELISRWNCTQSHKIRFVETIPRLHSLSHISPSTSISGLCHQSSNLSPSPARNNELVLQSCRGLLLLNWCVRFSSSPKNPPKPEWGLDQATNRTNSCILDSFRQTPFSGGSLTHPEPSINSCPGQTFGPVHRPSSITLDSAAGCRYNSFSLWDGLAREMSKLDSADFALRGFLFMDARRRLVKAGTGYGLVWSCVCLAKKGPRWIRESFVRLGIVEILMFG